MKCESCGTEDNIVGVCCVPGIPYSACYCINCLKANSHPMFILIANTAINGGLDQCADWWKQMVEDSCKHQNKSLVDFNLEVQQEINNYDNQN